MSLRGSVCLYQGEELGLGEAELAFEDLQDPYGIRFWPEFKGRDGCRTPMVWDDAKPNGGFSTAKPWLPVAKDHLPLAVNKQQGDPRLAARTLSPLSGLPARTIPRWPRAISSSLPSRATLLRFARDEGNEQIVCAFNLGSTPASIDLGAGKKASSLSGHGLSGKAEGGKIRLQGYGAWFGRLA